MPRRLRPCGLVARSRSAKRCASTLRYSLALLPLPPGASGPTRRGVVCPAAAPLPLRAAAGTKCLGRCGLSPSPPRGHFHFGGCHAAAASVDRSVISFGGGETQSPPGQACPRVAQTLGGVDPFAGA